MSCPSLSTFPHSSFYIFWFLSVTTTCKPFSGAAEGLDVPLFFYHYPVVEGTGITKAPLSDIVLIKGTKNWSCWFICLFYHFRDSSFYYQRHYFSSLQIYLSLSPSVILLKASSSSQMARLRTVLVALRSVACYVSSRDAKVAIRLICY